ncbi:toast rack family protein [Bacillus salitolerans]|uniref:Toast rack family protein n=1 Tax=Bacillus salitolerans TaxID=1437434 RepID=A0ABW4LP86_9BACI
MRKWLIGLSVIAIFLMMGCTNIVNGDMTSSKDIIEKDGAKELKVDLHLGAGEMVVTSGSNEWAEGAFEFSKPNMKPEVSYKLKGDTGHLDIEQPSTAHLTSIKEYKNKWDLYLTQEIPISLNVKTGASEAELHLSGLQLNELGVDAGVGRTLIDLSGDWRQGFHAKINAGVGETELILPKSTGVKLKIENGIGDTNINGLISKEDNVYVNDLYDSSEMKIEIDLKVGVGSIDVREE